MLVAQRLTEMEASLANINNVISISFISDDELEAVRLETFDQIKTIEQRIDRIKNTIELLEETDLF